jgi:putative transposase
MPNHVYLIAVPESEDGLRRAIGEAHRRYTRRVSFREGWRGHLWQGRFASLVMDEGYLLACARYVERNPVRAGLCARSEQYPWSSAAAHASGKDDVLVRVRPLLKLVPRWARHVSADPDEATVRRFRRHEATGRLLRPRKPGRKKSDNAK